MATAIKAHLSLKVSNRKHSGMRCCICSLGTANVRTRELLKKASTARDDFLRRVACCLMN